MRLIIIFGIISTINGSVNNSNVYLNFLIKNEKFNTALVELDRLVFTYKEDYNKLGYFKAVEAYIYQVQTNHNKAINIYRELLHNNCLLNKNIIDTLKYNYALSLFEIGQFESSLSILNNLNLKIAEELLYGNLILLSEKNVYERYNLSRKKISGIKKLQSELKNPFAGALLSSIVPGLGQIYAKHYFDGVQSCVINLIAFSFVHLSIKENNNNFIFPIITLTGTGLFYIANVLSAKKTVYYYNQRLKKMFIINNGLQHNPVLIKFL